jgi:hypothetical protein
MAGSRFVLEILSIDDENKINKSVASGEDAGTRSPTASSVQQLQKADQHGRTGQARSNV